MNSFADNAARAAQAKRIVNALLAVGGYKETARWSKVEFDAKISGLLHPEDQALAWVEYLSNEHGEDWFYNPDTDNWEQE